MPITEQTHETACESTACRQGQSNKRLALIAQRACKQMTGYFAGYISKRQPVGKYELKASAANLAPLLQKMKGKKKIAQWAKVVNRMFTDLETKGTLRTAPETFNLAANLHDQDIMNAEFIRTFQSVSFPGRAFLNRQEAAVKRGGPQVTSMSKPQMCDSECRCVCAARFGF